MQFILILFCVVLLVLFLCFLPLPCITNTKTSLKARTLSEGILCALLWQQKHLHNSQWMFVNVGWQIGFKGGSFLGGSDCKESVNLPKYRRSRFNLWVGKIPWRKEWQLPLVLLPGKFHGQRSLVGYSPWGCTQSDMTNTKVYFPDFK